MTCYCRVAGTGGTGSQIFYFSVLVKALIKKQYAKNVAKKYWKRRFSSYKMATVSSTPTKVTAKLNNLVFFICYLAALQPTLGHWRGGSITNPIIITAFVTYLTHTSPGILWFFFYYYLYFLLFFLIWFSKLYTVSFGLY